MRCTKTSGIAGLFLRLLLILLFSGSGHLSAESDPKIVQVGFYLLSAGRLDLEKSEISLDFYLWLSFNGSETPKLEFMNSRDAIIVQQTMQSVATLTPQFSRVASFRVTGNFEQNLNMNQYPFEKHQITVVLEDAEEDLTVRRYIPDPTGPFTDQGFRVMGWNIDECKTSAATHTYASSFGILDSPIRDYSQIVFSLTISRNNWVMLVKFFVPVVLLLIIGMMSLVFPDDNLNQKVSLGVASLFSSVAYHINLTKSMPPVGYLTFIDRLMIGQYALLFLTLLTAIFTFSILRAGQPEMATGISWIGRILVPISAISLYISQLNEIFFF